MAITGETTPTHPHFFFFFFFGYTENLKSVTLAAPVLTWGSPALTRAPAQLIYRNLELEESRRGWFDCGQLWKWLCVLWSRGRPCQIWPPHPLHSLRYPTGDISGPSIAKALLQYSGCKGGMEHRANGERESATTTTTTTTSTRAPCREKRI